MFCSFEGKFSQVLRKSDAQARMSTKVLDERFHHQVVTSSTNSPPSAQVPEDGTEIKSSPVSISMTETRLLDIQLQHSIKASKRRGPPTRKHKNDDKTYERARENKFEFKA